MVTQLAVLLPHCFRVALRRGLICIERQPIFVLAVRLFATEMKMYEPLLGICIQYAEKQPFLC